MLRSMILHHGGFPIRKSADIMLICSSPRLIAACHVLHRLLMPRHSPYALVRLNFLYNVSHYTMVLFELSEFLLNFTFRIILTLYAWKDFLFAFCTCFWVFHLTVKLYAHFCAFPFSFGKTYNLDYLSSSVRFLLKSFFYSVFKDLWNLSIPGRSGWTRTIDLALIRRAL